MRYASLGTMEEKGVVYWEKQEKDSLTCGVHCLNSLLQEPTFDEIELAEIGLHMDMKERELMGGKQISQNSANVSETGNYSIQVLTEALNRRAKYEVHPVGEKSLKMSLSKESGFIFNPGDHWFTLRKVFGQWFNLNSLMLQPQQISETELHNIISDVYVKGINVYCVRGPFKDPKPSKTPLRPNQFLIKFRDLMAGVSPEESQKKEEDTFQAFSGKGVKLAGEVKKFPGKEIDAELQEILEISKAEQLSNLCLTLSPEPAPTQPNSLSLNMRLPDGRQLSRRFLNSQKLYDIINYLNVELNTIEEISLICPFPRKPYTDINAGIGATFGGNSTVIVDIKKN